MGLNRWNREYPQSHEQQTNSLERFHSVSLKLYGTTPIGANVAWKKRGTMAKVRTLTRRSKNEDGRTFIYSKHLAEPGVRERRNVAKAPSAMPAPQIHGWRYGNRLEHTIWSFRPVRGTKI